jgi:hypothetical protein
MVSGVGPCLTQAPAPTLKATVEWKIGSPKVQLMGHNTDILLASLFV